ncbi:PAS domain-containing protein [Acidaminobacter sp. JC074]|uniref:PAS domain-containing protein n=1 Tax=Acidaminobacter sp. JC074 TaxID=2530199 RepID=UPI001F0DB28B|nr:PAS domain-containing protein [Acidaminobacter sp. JC074]MCH4887674.1 PAS domain-containing protein [Acidaminobacter sp. JC074]
MNIIIDKKICPVTQLDIIESPRWKNLKISDNYLVSFRKIGNHIVDVHTYGRIVDFDAERYQHFLDKFLEDQSIEFPYVEMRNYEDLTGILPTKVNIRIQKDYFIENKEKHIGFIAYNANRGMDLILKSGKRQYSQYNVDVGTEADYKSAVLRAVSILKNYSPYKKFIKKKKYHKISSHDIEEIAISCGEFLWEDNDMFDFGKLNIDAEHPLYPIVENFAIIREELIHLENESFNKSKALESEKLQTEKIVESLQSGIIIVDPRKDQVVDVNPAACAMLGGRKEEIIGKPFSRFLAEEEDYNEAYNSRDSYLLSLQEVSVPVLRSSVKVRLNNKQYLLENFVDISEAKEHEEKLKKSLAHTKQLNNLTFNREKRIIEMKKEVNALLIEAGKEPKYKSVIKLDKDRGVDE